MSSHAGRPPAAVAGGRTRLRAYRNPLRLAVSGGLWAGAGYLLVYLVTGWVLFSIAFAAVGVAALLAITIAGLPMLIATGAAIRGCANFERARLRRVFAEPVRGRYRSLAGPGIVSRVRTQWRDPATWHDVAYLLGMFIPLLILDVVVLAVWLTFLAGVTLPIWYRYSRYDYSAGNTVHGVPLGYFPSGPNGHPRHGIFVDTLPRALLVAAAFLVLWLLFNYVVLAAARTHATVARALLRAPEDPLADVKDMLARPSPLPPLTEAAPADRAPGQAPLTPT